MAPYSIRFAELYDLFYADKPYAEEAQFVHRCLQSRGITGEVLELACGTASHAFELERLGYQVTATDISADMLACARRKKEARGSKVVLRQMDMRRIDYPANSFQAVVCLFDSIGYLRTNEAIIEMLTGVSRVLQAGGVFICEFWHAAAMLKYFEPVRVRRWPTPSGLIERISETRIDYARNLVTVDFTIYEPLANGQLQCYRESHTNRCFSIPEMEMLLQQSGLRPRHWYAGFRDDERIRADTWHIVAVAQKPKGVVE